MAVLDLQENKKASQYFILTSFFFDFFKKLCYHKKKMKGLDFIMITLAIDGSTHSTGVAVFNDKHLIYYNCIQSNATNTFKRIKYMVAQIKKIYTQYHPQQVVMQEVLPENVKHNQNVYKALIYLQAEVVLMFDQYNIHVEFIPVNTWRRICQIPTGPRIKRQALKEASKQLVKNVFNIQVNDDISDSICLGMAYIKQYGF